MDDLVTTLAAAITDFVAHDERNAMAAHNGMRIFDAPLAGVAAADDGWFARFAEPGIVGPGHMTPGEWLIGARSVLCWFLPFTQAVRDSNRAPGLPSEEWTSSRIDGEAFNNALRAFAADWLKGRGGEALAPALDPRYAVKSRVPNWSERHAAFAAGLGTFGLHRALITQKGTAGRLGSVITTLSLAPTPRPYARFDEYCPFLTRREAETVTGGRVKCGACIRRCPAGAISERGKDHALCSDFMDREVLPLYAPRYGCAKCNVGVPCESGLPR
jgi:epoxyqueuosine reductase QueG